MAWRCPSSAIGSLGSAAAQSRIGPFRWPVAATLPSGASAIESTNPPEVLTSMMSATLVTATGGSGASRLQPIASAAIATRTKIFTSSYEREGFDVRLAAGEPADVERAGVHGDGAAVHEHLGHELAGDRAVHETVAAEASDD